MSGEAGYKTTVRVSEDDPAALGFDPAVSWKELPMKDANLTHNGEPLDDTNMKDNPDGWKTFVLGLLEWGVAGGLVRTLGDDASALVSAAQLNRTDLWAQYLPLGVTQLSEGFQGKVIIPTFGLNSSIADLQMRDLNLQGNGALAVAS